MNKSNAELLGENKELNVQIRELRMQLAKSDEKLQKAIKRAENAENQPVADVKASIAEGRRRGLTAAYLDVESFAERLKEEYEKMNFVRRMCFWHQVNVAVICQSIVREHLSKAGEYPPEILEILDIGHGVAYPILTVSPTTFATFLHRFMVTRMNGDGNIIATVEIRAKKET